MLYWILLFFSSLSLLQADIFYLEISELFPSQLRYSSQNVKEKIRKKIKSGAATWNELEKRWELSYHNGESALSSKEALPVMKSSFGYVLVDGHHDLLASVGLEAKSIPVRVVADFSSLSEEEFWKRAEKEGLAYPYDIDGNRLIPSHDFGKLQDDSNRFFAAIAGRKYPMLDDLSVSTGAIYPLWIKVGKDTPFIEFMIADALYKAGIVYPYEMGDTPSDAFVEKARKVLEEAKIPKLRLVKERLHYTELELSQVLSGWPQPLSHR
ncbi:MAG: hypothetical protein JSR76_02330 [Verrucomicrobia bacterium]|nr:hypothetical protein [Verrucomicrobiota bacterium]